MFGGKWQGWLRRIVPDAGTRSRQRRRRGLFSPVVPAEVLETRVLLSATHLVFQVQPANGTAGQSFSVTVEVENSSGTVVSTNDSVIRLTVREPGRFAGDGHTMTATAVNGIATFDNLVLDKAGTYTLLASTGHTHRAVSDSFVIAPDTSGPEQLVFLRWDARRGTVDLAVEDQFGNIIKTNDSSVTLSVNSGPTQSFDSSVPSPYTVSTQNGVAKFSDAILDTAGTYTLGATDSNTAVSSAVSDSVTINAQGQHNAEGHHHWH